VCKSLELLLLHIYDIKTKLYYGRCTPPTHVIYDRIFNLRENARMSVEEIFVEYRVVVGEGLGETRQSCGRNLLQCSLVRLVTDATHVDDHTVLSIRDHGHPGILSRDRHFCMSNVKHGTEQIQNHLSVMSVCDYTVSQKNDTDVAHYNFNAQQPILDFWHILCLQSMLSNEICYHTSSS